MSGMIFKKMYLVGIMLSFVFLFTFNVSVFAQTKDIKKFVDIDDVIKSAGAIVEATISNKEVVVTRSDGWGFTQYKLCSIDIIMGEIDSSIIVDGCLSMKVPGAKLITSGVAYPPVGYRFIFFLSQLEEYHNPISSGMYGIYSIENVNGVDYVLSYTGYSIFSIDKDGIILVAKELVYDRSMTKSDFFNKIKEHSSYLGDGITKSWRYKSDK